MQAAHGIGARRLYTSYVAMSGCEQGDGIDATRGQEWLLAAQWLAWAGSTLCARKPACTSTVFRGRPQLKVHTPSARLSAYQHDCCLRASALFAIGAKLQILRVLSGQYNSNITPAITQQ